MNYNKQKKRLAFRGVNLNCPVDAIPEDQLGIATNVRPTQQGTLDTRPAIAPFLSPFTSPIHSIKTFTSKGAVTRFSGSGGSLAQNNTTVDSGFSGNPLSFAAYQPSQAVEPFLYVGDSARYSKVRGDGTRFNVGIVPPSGPPDANLIEPLYTDIIDAASTWTPGGTAGATSPIARVPGGTTIQAILYDSGTTGWACVAFSGTVTTWLNKGLRCLLGSQVVFVSDMIPAASQSPTTVAAIQYDSGVSGACCVVLASSTDVLSRDAMVRIGVEYVRVLSVAIGEDNSRSFRCVTTAAHSVGDAVTFVNCARIFDPGSHAGGTAVTEDALGFTVTVGQGTESSTLGTALDLSQINGRPITPEDWMHISLLFDNLSNVLDVRVLLDVDNTNNDFQHNFFYADVTPNVLQPASAGASAVVTAAPTGLQTSATQSQIHTLKQQALFFASFGDYAAAASLLSSIRQLSAQTNAQLETGVSQWSEVFIPFSSLVRVGNDETVGLNSVKAIQIQVSCIDTVNVEADSWWIGGTYGPNAPQSINPENPIKYTYRYRSTITGAKSTWSPLNRGGIFPERQGVLVSQLAFSTDLQVDTIDIARVGASIDGVPQFLASIVNNTGGGFGTYSDNYTDAELGDGIEPGDNQPWPVQQLPIQGTCSVTGTSVVGTSVAIPTNLCEGTLVLINGQATVIRGLPSAHAFQIEDNIATATGATLQIPTPTTFGNPLPYLAGPYDESFFAAGDTVNPGRIYWSNRTNPDMAKTSNFLDLTSSAEPILGVCVYNGYVVAMTGERFFIGATTGNPQQPYAFTTTSVGKGLLTPWAFTVGPAIFFWTSDGISETDLGPAKSITFADLSPYMPHEGLVGAKVNGYLPPNPSVVPRLAYCKNGFLYFDFTDTSGNLRTLLNILGLPGWWFDCYTPAVTMHYQDEADDSILVLTGCIDGTVEVFSKNSSDSGGAINCQARLGAQNFGDIRSLKQAIDLCITLCGTVQATVYANSWTVQDYTSSLTGVVGTPVILPIAAAYDASKLYLDLALDLTWTGVQEVIEFDLGYLQNPMLAADFVSNPTTLQFDGYGHIREVILNTVAKAALTANLVIQAEFPGTITIPLSIPQGPFRQYIPIPANKSMLYEWSLQGSGLDFGMFACDLHVKGWRESEYRLATPFLE